MSAVVAAGRPWLLRGRDAVGRGANVLEGLPVLRVLGVLVVVEWLAVLATALVVHHAGWIYYQGGDQLWLYTLGWLLGHGQLSQTLVGYGWPAFLAPVSRIAGPNLVPAFPAIILFNVVVLLPIAIVSLYGIAARIAGRLAGYWAVVLWIALPFVGILYTNTGYHQRYTELTLPQSFGLTAMADFPTTVATLVSIYFVVKALFSENPQLIDGVAAGVAAGVAIAIKPATSLFLVGPALALAYRKRFAIAGVMLAGIAPALVTLAVWKERGLGHVPLLSSSQAHTAGLAAAAPLAGLNIGRYWHTLDWNRFLSNLDLLREHFWSGRLIEWLVIAGLIALARRSITAALLVGGWFGAFVLVKGSYANASVQDASLFRIMMPSFAAFVLLIASLPLLIPHAPAKVRSWRPAVGGPSVRARWILIGLTVVVSALVPLGAIAAASTHGSLDPAEVQSTIMPVPVNVDIGAAASVHGRRVTLTWRSQSSTAGPVFYRIWRGRSDGLSCPALPGGRLCQLDLPELGTTHATTFVDRAPRGHWVYRVAVAANWLDSASFGDAYVVSRPIAVTVR